MKIKVKSGSFSWSAVIHDTPTGRLVKEALPLKSRANRWGEEIYFSIPVDAGLETGASDVVERGDLGYWPSGKAFCIFFGKTPISSEGEIRAANAVNILGKLKDELVNLHEVKDGDEVTVEEDGLGSDT